MRLQNFVIDPAPARVVWYHVPTGLPIMGVAAPLGYYTIDRLVRFEDSFSSGEREIITRLDNWHLTNGPARVIYFPHNRSAMIPARDLGLGDSSPWWLPEGNQLLTMVRALCENRPAAEVPEYERPWLKTIRAGLHRAVSS